MSALFSVSAGTVYRRKIKGTDVDISRHSAGG